MTLSVTRSAATAAECTGVGPTSLMKKKAPLGPYSNVKGYLAHKKQRTPRALQEDYAYGPVVVPRGGGGSYERGTPVH